MDLKKKEKIKTENLDELLTKFRKIKDTVSNLKQVNNIFYFISTLFIIYRQMIFFSFLSIINQSNIYIIQIQ